MLSSHVECKTNFRISLHLAGLATFYKEVLKSNSNEDIWRVVIIHRIEIFVMLKLTMK